jgi:dipeptidyl aminopeptidase/acylaminoacyl peptidase
MRFVRRIIIVVTAAVASIVPLATIGSAAPTDQIAFERDGDIWVMNADGTGEVNITNHPAIDAHPDWSPDGTKIAFVSNRNDVPANADGNLEVFTMNADGSAVTQVTDSVYPFPGQFGYDHYHPSWSPEGSRLTYEWDGPQGREVYVIDVDGTGETLITDPLDPANKLEPDWSPVDGRIAYTWGFGYLSGQDVHVINADGTGDTNLTSDTEFSDEFDAAWSPDGTRFAFVTTRNPGQFGLPNEDIYAMQSDGSGLIQLTDYLGFDNNPSWTPDGTQVTFSSARNGAYDLFTVDVPPPPAAAARGSASFSASVTVPPAEQLTDTPGSEGASSWRPVAPQTFLLRVATAGSGRGGVISRPAGIRCGGDCTEAFAAGTRIRLKAMPAAGSVFLGWRGACTSRNDSCTVTIERTTRVAAVFASR